MTQWVFTTVSLANLLWFFLLGSGPVGCLLCCLSNGKTQIWLGDLRLALFLVFCVLVVFLVVICQASCDHRRPCSSFLTNSFVSCKDRALERDRPDRREKKNTALSLLASKCFIFVSCYALMAALCDLGILAGGIPGFRIVVCCFTHTTVWQCDFCVSVFSLFLVLAIPIPELIQAITSSSSLVFFPSNAFMASARSFNTFNCMLQIKTHS